MPHLHALECSHWIDEAILHGVVVEKPKMDSEHQVRG